MDSAFQEIKQRFNMASVAERIIAITVGITVLEYLYKALASLMTWNPYLISNWFALPANFNDFTSKFWTIFTYGFLHGGFWHILFNMLILYFISRIFLDFFSREQFLVYYFGGIIAGGAIYLMSYNLLPALVGQNPPLVGASAGVTAVLIGLAAKIPNYALIFRFIGAIKLWHIAVAFILMDIIQLPMSNTGGHLAHLGGALIGFLLTRQLNEGKNISSNFSNLFKPKKQKPLKTVYKNPEQKSAAATKDVEQLKIDKILDKISQSGYDTLTQEEKDFLFSVGKKK